MPVNDMLSYYDRGFATAREQHARTLTALRGGQERSDMYLRALDDVAVSEGLTRTEVTRVTYTA